MNLLLHSHFPQLGPLLVSLFPESSLLEVSSASSTTSSLATVRPSMFSSSLSFALSSLLTYHHFPCFHHQTILLNILPVLVNSIFSGFIFFIIFPFRSFFYIPHKIYKIRVLFSFMLGHRDAFQKMAMAKVERYGCHSSHNPCPHLRHLS